MLLAAKRSELPDWGGLLDVFTERAASLLKSIGVPTSQKSLTTMGSNRLSHCQVVGGKLFCVSIA